MPYLLDLTYLLAPLLAVFVAMRLGGGDRLEVAVIALLAMALLYPAYVLAVALGRRAAQRRSSVQSGIAIRAVAGREAWLLWLTFPLVALYCVLIDVLRKYLTPLFYKHPIDLVMLVPRQVPATWPAGRGQTGGH